MDKVRFACPRCRTIMQTDVDKVGYDVACPHCAHRFRIVESEQPTTAPNSATAPSPGPMGGAEAATIPPQKGIGKPASPATSPAGHTYGAAASPPAGGTSTGYACPYCQTTAPPIWKSEVSQVGWIVFAILLVTTCVFCFAGLFIRDKYRVCSRCKVRLG